MKKIVRNSITLFSPSIFSIIIGFFTLPIFLNYLGVFYYGKPILLPAPDCKTADGKFIDMKNCIFYKTKVINNKHYVIDKSSLLKKIKEFLSNEKLRLSMYDNYYSLIKNHHTRLKRAMYIKNNIQKLF
jgi:hypothetical protein